MEGKIDTLSGPVILIVEDDLASAKLISASLKIEEFQTILAHTAENALNTLSTKSVDCVLLDLNLPDQHGLTVLENILAERPFCPVIIITGENDLKTGIVAMKKGAKDYLLKPLDMDEVVRTIERVLRESYFNKKEELEIRQSMFKKDHELVYGINSPLEQVLGKIHKLKDFDSTILITGESGTGKDLLAKFIQKYSKRCNFPFIQINCSALPESLLESELFGHEKGAFTGAVSRKEGIFSIADKGTLFLDEIGDMSLNMQAKILRVLQSGEIRRVGGSANLYVDVRIIAATNKNLKQEIAQGKFREDLYFRLNVISFEIPPLRERRDDVSLLSTHFLGVFNPRKPASLEPAAMNILKKYSWPGNVRELKNAIERLSLLSVHSSISPMDIKENLPLIFSFAQNDGDFKQSETLAKVEENHIFDILNKCKGNKSKAAKILGITVQTLYNKLKDYSRTT